MEENAANSRGEKMGARNSNFGIFYKHEDEESHLILFIHKYWSVDIQYICNIKKNKFKPKNIMKLNTSVRHTREVTKSLKIGINGLKIKTKKEDCITVDAKDIISLLGAFYIYIQIHFFFGYFEK